MGGYARDVERRRKITTPDGQLADAVELGYRTSGEYWNEYLADDGSVIRLKPVVTGIMRVEGQFDPQGDPVYVVNTANVVVVSAPDELRRDGVQ